MLSFSISPGSAIVVSAWMESVRDDPIVNSQRTIGPREKPQTESQISSESFSVDRLFQSNRRRHWRRRRRHVFGRQVLFWLIGTKFSRWIRVNRAKQVEPRIWFVNFCSLSSIAVSRALVLSHFLVVVVVVVRVVESFTQPLFQSVVCLFCSVSIQSTTSLVVCGYWFVLECKLAPFGGIVGKATCQLFRRFRFENRWFHQASSDEPDRGQTGELLWM